MFTINQGCKCCQFFTATHSIYNLYHCKYCWDKWHSETTDKDYAEYIEWMETIRPEIEKFINEEFKGWHE